MDNDPFEEKEERNIQKEESKPALPSRKPRLGQSSLAQMAVLPIMTAVQQASVCATVLLFMLTT